MVAQPGDYRYCHRVNHLVQKDIGKPGGAMKTFNAKTWNAHAGVMDPGLMMFWPAWNRVSHIVTKQAVTYSNPVHGCPTSDNVMVHVDISISFQVGPTEDDAYIFVYSLGAHRFDKLLYSLTEEAIRGLVHSVRHDQVHDLREEFAMGMKTDLNAKLKSYGVFIHNVKEKNQENQMRVLLNQETLRLTALERQNERAIQDLKAESVRAAIIRDERRTMAEAKAAVTVAEHISINKNKVENARGIKASAVETVTAMAVKRKALPAVQLKTLKAEFQQYVMRPRSVQKRSFKLRRKRQPKF
ncbi:hypothetical protein PHYBOEH_007920 [Phytophthora boehmeriae]|uniref:Band 7 domain-containing protein n=1 Tax=Phytophthora boehmeriae TaxID=109152 RepID=A0A8T1W3T0_9STRA|nr:hypothetical protein PHYBOEH_007920 [Phytophthora boehmeriae]